MLNIYWANSLFAEADRTFNSVCVSRLRAQGFSVFLPQELPANTVSYTPTAAEIFSIDTSAVLSSDVVVAVIDGETIDSGVAAEIGVAHAAGISVVGLYTDIRRGRSAGQMYKNLYILGLLELSLGIANSLDDLIALLTGHQYSHHERAIRARRGVDPDEVVGRIESLTRPIWSPHQEVGALIQRYSIRTIADFGCGTGSLVGRLAGLGRPELAYVGFDTDVAMVKLARERQKYSWARFESDSGRFMERIGEAEQPCMLNFSFVLHDIRDLTSIRRV